jgi:hypothetical protein
MNNSQKNDMKLVFGNLKNLGNLDYVTAWYWKASLYIEKTPIRVAFVSTNSITQGEQPAIFFKPLMEKENGIKIDFAYRTFIWNSGANNEAQVHCVIVGFSCILVKMDKYLYLYDNSANKVKNINGYLVDAPNIFVKSRRTVLFDCPHLGIGNQPIDDGNYLFSKVEMDDFIKKEPLSVNYFHKWYGSREFINNNPRYCLYLGEGSPSELKKMPECLKRVEAVKNFRSKSKRVITKRASNTPTQFCTTNIPSDTYLVIPTVSTQRRRYVPMGFLGAESFCSDATRLIATDEIYYFGILESNVNMAWLRAVGGR